MTVAAATSSSVDDARSRALSILPTAVRTLMTAHRVPGKDLAEVLHLSASQLSERLSGKTRFSADEVVGIAAYFGVAVGVLFSDPRDSLKTRSEKSQRAADLGLSVIHGPKSVQRKPANRTLNLSVLTPT